MLLLCKATVVQTTSTNCGTGKINKHTTGAYVTQVIDKELDDKVTQFLGILMTLQEKLNKSDPQRAMLRRRLVFGTREVLRAAKGKAAKCVIVATNIDEGKSSGGLDETVQKILGFSRENQIPVVFALRRRTLGKSLGKTVKMSTVAIYNAAVSYTHLTLPTICSV